MMLTTATPTGTVTSLEASSWRCPFFPASSTEGNLLSAPWIRRRRHSHVVPFLGASSWWLVESLVQQLESVSHRSEHKLLGRYVRRRRSFFWVEASFGQVRSRRSLADS